MPKLMLPDPDALVTELETYADELNGLRAGEWTDKSTERMTLLSRKIGATDDVLRTVQRIAEVSAQAELTRMAQEGSGPEGATRAVRTFDSRSTGDRMTDNDEYRAWANRGGRGTFEFEARTLVTTAGGQGGFGGADDGPGLFIPAGTPQFLGRNAPQTRLFMRDVLTVIGTTLTSVPFIVEKNPATHDAHATFVAEGAAKPEAALEFEAADAPIRKIAVWIPATYEILADAPTLRGYIDQRLRYMLQVREEQAFLNGNGTSPNLRGIRQTTGLLTQAWVADGAFAALGLAMGQIEANDGSPSFVAMHPTDYWTAITSRHANQFDGSTGGQAAPFRTPPAVVWDVPVIRTTGMSRGTALVGAREGAVVFDREAAVIRVGDQHADYFTTNRVAILAEERVGLAVHRPDWFVEVATAAPVQQGA